MGMNADNEDKPKESTEDHGMITASRNGTEEPHVSLVHQRRLHESATQAGEMITKFGSYTEDNTGLRSAIDLEEPRNHTPHIDWFCRLPPPGNGALPVIDLETLDDWSGNGDNNIIVDYIDTEMATDARSAPICSVEDSAESQDDNDNEWSEGTIHGQLAVNDDIWSTLLQIIDGETRYVTDIPPLNWHPKTQESFETWKQKQKTATEAFFIYTDGSAGERRRDTELIPQAKWAFAAWAYTAGQNILLHWERGHVHVERESQHWHGAIKATALEGERAALIAGTLWANRALAAYRLPITFCFDNVAAGYGASGKWQIRRTQLDAMLLRSLMQTLAERTGQHPHYRHVAAHSGDPYNEFVDTLAYDAYHQDIWGPPLDFDVRKLLDQEHPLCAHWPLVVRLLAQKKTVPTVQNGTLHWQYPNAMPNSDVVWKDLEEAEEPISAVHMLQLRCVTYNVQTLKDSGDPVGIGASSFLRAQLIDRRYDVVFLQETRARQSCVQETVDYRRYISAANTQGGGGTEIWLSKKSRWTPNNTLTWELPNNVVVLEATAEYLILRVDIHGQPLFLISAHGPHAGHEKEEVQEWWHRLDQHFGRLVGQSATIIGIDANAHFQEPIQGAIGEAGLENKGNEPARMMGEFLTRWGLWSPSTFTTIHRGPHGTWCHPHRGTWHRCDYLVLSGNFYEEEILTWVDGNIDAASGALDHMPVAIQMIVAWRDSRNKRNRRQPHIDLLALKEATPQQVEDALQRCTNIPWGLNVHEHGAEFVRLVREGLATAFPTQKKGPHRDYITKETWELRNRRRDIRRRLYKRQREVRSSDVCAAFQAWRHNKSISAYLAQGQRWYLRTLLQNLHDRNQLRTMGPAIKRRLRADRDQFCQQVAQEAASLPPSMVMQKMRCIGVMGKRRRREARPLHQITDKEGNLLQDADAINARWQQHFEELEDGHACTKEDLLKSCVRVQQQHTKIVPSWSELPTILDIEESFRLNKTGRASFFDGIPTDLCHLFPQILAKVFYELALKQTLHIAEPITFKGGVLIHAYKGKGPATSCGSYRSLMVSSVLAKSLHRVLRSKCMATFRDTAMPLQLGGLPGKAVSQGAQCLVAFAASCRRRKTSLGILFIDIRQAFYRLVRQHVIQDQDIDRSTQRLFQTLDLPPSAFQEFARELAQPSAVETAGVDPFVQQHVAECLNATWFRLKDSKQISATRKGSRPGDNMADLLFTFAFRRIMARILEVIEADNIDMSFSGCGDPHPFPQYMEVQYCTNFKTLGPVWADDLAVLVESPNAQELLPKLRVIARTIIDMLAIYGMQVNSDRGKSELVLDLRGSGAHKARQEIYRHRQPCLDVETRHEGVVHLNIVAKYKHLGTLFAAKGSMMPEIRQRIGQARSEFQRYRKQIYANKALPTRTRVELFKSLVLSGLSFNVAIWPVLTKQEHGAFTGGLHGLYNSLAYAIWGDTVYEWREEQVISKLQVVDAPTLTILARLRHLHHLVCQGDEYVWAFVHRDEGWLGLIAHDLLWLQRQCSRATPQQDPRDDSVACGSVF